MAILLLADAHCDGPPPAGGEQDAHEFAELGTHTELFGPGGPRQRQDIAVTPSMEGSSTGAGRMPPPPWPDRAVAAAAVKLFEARGGLIDHASLPSVFSPSPSPQYRNLLAALGGPYRLRIACAHADCSGPLGWWRLEPSKGIAVVDDRPSRPADRNQNARPFTAAARDGKGYRSGPNTHDADGTYTATCSRCHHKKQLGPSYRTRLFLTALRDHQDTVYA
jgi:hypothetical protein